MGDKRDGFQENGDHVNCIYYQMANKENRNLNVSGNGAKSRHPRY